MGGDFLAGESVFLFECQGGYPAGHIVSERGWGGLRFSLISQL